MVTEKPQNLSEWRVDFLRAKKSGTCWANSEEHLTSTKVMPIEKTSWPHFNNEPGVQEM